MKKKPIIILSVVLLAAVVVLCCLLLRSEMPLPALPVEYRTVEVPSDPSAPFVDDFSVLISDAEDAAALAETVYAIRYAKNGDADRIPCAVAYDPEKGVYAVELINAEYAAAARKGQSVNLLGGRFTIYLNEKDGAVLAVEIED